MFNQNQILSTKLCDIIRPNSTLGNYQCNVGFVNQKTFPILGNYRTNVQQNCKKISCLMAE